MGPIEQSITKQAKRSGRPIPDRIKNAPKLSRPGLQLYLDAFFELDSERSHSLSLTPIPGSCIRSYADYYEFDHEQAEDLLFLIREMDAENLQRLKSKNNG